MSASYIKTLQAVSDKFDALCTFVAKNGVMSNAIGTYEMQMIMEKGDTVQVIKWMCQKGPTEIIVHSLRKGTKKSTCIPFGWLMEAGPSPELEMYMPFPEQTWKEIIEGKKSSKKRKQN